jgi:hypothetical protein
LPIEKVTFASRSIIDHVLDHLIIDSQNDFMYFADKGILQKYTNNDLFLTSNSTLIMKQLLFSLFTLISGIGFSQEIPKYTNTIIVHNVGFKQVKDVLLDQGFLLTNRMRKTGQLLPNPKVWISIKDSEYHSIVTI